MFALFFFCYFPSKFQCYLHFHVVFEIRSCCNNFSSSFPVVTNLMPEAMKRYETDLKVYQEKMTVWKTAYDE